MHDGILVREALSDSAAVGDARDDQANVPCNILGEHRSGMDLSVEIVEDGHDALFTQKSAHQMRADESSSTGHKHAQAGSVGAHDSLRRSRSAGKRKISTIPEPTSVS